MSSTPSLVVLQPDTGSRCFVLVSAGLAGALGLAIIAVAELSTVLRCGAALVWLGSGARQLLHIARSYKTCRAYRLSQDGSFECLTGRGWEVAKLRAGSVLLAGCAWLRYAREGCDSSAELLRRSSNESENWRRFHVIWRHLGAADRSC